MKKKILSSVLAIALMLSILPTGLLGIRASAASSGYYTYSVTNGEATITDCDTSISGDITIPSKLSGYPVTSIGDFAFEDCSGLTSITIPNGITSIGFQAFSYCNNLISIVISNNVVSIREWAFTYCDKLTNIIVNENNAAFCSVDGVLFNKEKTELIYYPTGRSGTYSIPNCVTSIGVEAFYACKKLKGVTIPDSVTSIGNYAFSNCCNLASVTIGKGVTSIGKHAFLCCCENLTSVTIPNSVTDIEEMAFFACDNLETVYYTGAECQWKAISTGGHAIPSEATINYNSAHNYKSVVTAPTCETDGYSTYTCSSCGDSYTADETTALGHSYDDGVVIEPTATEQGYTTYTCTVCGDSYQGDFVPVITISGKTGDCTWTVNGTTLTISGNGQMANYPSEHPVPWDKTITSVIIEDGVTNIGSFAFYNCDNLTSINIPDSVTIIGNCAFLNCDSLENITIGKGVTSIGTQAISYCNSLTSIAIPSNVTNIGECAFSDCENLKNVTIHNGVKNIRRYAFSSCKSLECITIPDSVKIIEGNAFYKCSSLTSVIIPYGVTRIEMYAFCGCTSLASITIPNSVTSIDNHAFNGCQSLSSIEIPDSVTTIGEHAFTFCKSLTSITIPSSVTSIGDSAFNNCHGLASITIPSSVTSIGDSAFSPCSKLKTIYYTGTECQWNTISIGNNPIPSRANIVYASAHNYEITTVAPTQTETGYTINTCTVCGDVTYTNPVSSLSGRVQNVSASGDTELVTITWDALTAVDRYIVYIYDMDGNLVKCAQKPTNRAAFAGIEAGDYVTLVIAKTSSGWYEFLRAYEVAFTVSEAEPETSPKATIGEASYDSVTITWDAVEGATKYSVMLIGGEKTIYHAAATNSITVYGLEAGTEYEVYINAKTADGYIGYGEDTSFETAANPDVALTITEGITRYTLKWQGENIDKVWVKHVSNGTTTQIAVVTDKNTYNVAKNVAGDYYIVARVVVDNNIMYITSNLITVA